MGDGRFVASCIIKTQLFRKDLFTFSLLQVATATGISTKWFENFPTFKLWGVILLYFFPWESRIGSSLQEFQIIEGSRNWG